MHIAAIEGIDRIGKTTLIDLLRQLDSRIEVRKLEKAWTGTPESKLSWLVREACGWDMTDRVLVYDRLVIPSEHVYGDTIGLQEAVDTANRMGPLGLKYVYLDPGEFEPYRARVEYEPDAVFNTHHPQTFDRMVNRYRAFMAHVDVPVLSLEPGKKPDIETAEYVLDFILGKIRISL